MRIFGGPRRGASGSSGPPSWANLTFWGREDRVASGGRVTTWLDKSGAGHDFANLGLSRPLDNPTGVNGEPTLGFGGAREFLYPNTAFVLSDLISATGWAFYLVYKWTAVTTDDTIFGNGQWRTSVDTGVNPALRARYIDTAPSTIELGENVPMNTWTAIAWWLDGGDMFLQRLGQSPLTVPGLAVNDLSGAVAFGLDGPLGFGNKFTGEIAEAVLQSAYGGDPERTATMAYLAARYAL